MIGDIVLSRTNFSFAMEQRVLCFRYRTCQGSGGWFVNVSPGAPDTSLTFVRVDEADVVQAVTRFLEHRVSAPRGIAPARKPQEQFRLFG
jgi:hypothetical protein